ncbi:MAG: ABC transporter ATP-binding protein [Alkaliphilus sp.]
MEQNILLQVNNISKTYKIRKGESIKAVDDISFSVKKGEIFGLLGPNGAGKTTTVKMICALIRGDGGEILVNGVNNVKRRTKALRSISAVLEGNRNIYWRLTVRENLEFFAALKGKSPKKLKDKIDYYIDFFDLAEKEKETARNLSRGMQQKLAIATALVSGTEIILLDEPTLGLDVKASYEIRDLLKRIAKENGTTIIITTHDMSVVQEICERVIIINNGAIIAEDKVENLLRLFDTKSYRFVVEGMLTNEQKDLFGKTRQIEVIEKNEKTDITFSSNDTALFYDAIEILKRDNSIIESIAQKEVNFEKVFMEIIEEGEKNGKNSVVV